MCRDHKGIRTWACLRNRTEAVEAGTCRGKGQRVRSVRQAGGRGRGHHVRLGRQDQEFGFNSKGNRSHWRVLSRTVMGSNLHFVLNKVEYIFLYLRAILYFGNC